MATTSIVQTAQNARVPALETRISGPVEVLRVPTLVKSQPWL